MISSTAIDSFTDVDKKKLGHIGVRPSFHNQDGFALLSSTNKLARTVSNFNSSLRSRTMEILLFEILRSASGYWWRLKAGNGEVLCHSEILTTKQSAIDAIIAVKRIAPSAQTKDLT